ncbi:MAG: glycosyltransferase [Cyanobacteria bacterium P01_D01_bin.36]
MNILSQDSKICFIQTNAVWGACEEYLVFLSNGLTDQGWDVTLLYPESPVLSPMIEQLNPNIRLFAVPPGYLGSLSNLLRLIKVLRKIRPDIVHCNDPGVLAMLSSNLSGILHRVVTFHTPSQVFRYRFHAKVLQRWAMKLAWNFIVLSKSNQLVLAHRYAISDDKTHVVEHGLDSKKFDIPDTREQLRQQLGIRSECVLLGCVARLSAQKNHALLLDSYSMLSDELRARSHLLLVGEGELREELEAQVKRLGLQKHVTFSGYRKDIPQLLQAMDIFLLSSDFEGLPFAMLEAMAMGLPTVATAVPGNKDALIHRKTGSLVPPNQASAFKQAIADLIENPNQRQQMGAAARERFLAHYTQDRMIDDVGKLYTKLLTCNTDNKDSQTL